MNKEYLKDLTTKRIPEHYIDAAISACAAAALDLDARLRAIEQANASPASIPAENESEPAGGFQSAPDDAAAIEAACKAVGWVSSLDNPGAMLHMFPGDLKKFARTYHAKQSKREAATIAELRRQLERQAVEIQDLKSHAREWEEQAQLAARPAPGEVPELTRSEIADVCATVPSSEFINGAKVQEFSNWMVEFAHACIRAAFAKMPGREVFDFAAWWEKNKPKSSMTTYSHAFELCRDAIKAAGIPVADQRAAVDQEARRA